MELRIKPPINAESNIHHKSLARFFAAARSVQPDLPQVHAFTSFLTGITEPIEFSFMFLAPLLYLFHAFELRPQIKNRLVLVFQICKVGGVEQTDVGMANFAQPIEQIPMPGIKKWFATGKLDVFNMGKQLDNLLPEAFLFSGVDNWGVPGIAAG